MLQFQQHLFRAFFFTKWRHVPCALWRHLSSLPHQFSIFDDGNVVCIWIVEQHYGCKHCSTNNKKKLVIPTQTLERNFNPRKSKFRPSLASSLSPSPFITVGIWICSFLWKVTSELQCSLLESQTCSTLLLRVFFCIHRASIQRISYWLHYYLYQLLTYKHSCWETAKDNYLSDIELTIYNK